MGTLDDLGYEILMRVVSIFHGLCFSDRTRAVCLATVLPPGPERIDVEVPPDRWHGHIKIDFDRSTFFEATYDEASPWLPVFKDFSVCHRDEMERELAPYARAEAGAKKVIAPEVSEPRDARPQNSVTDQDSIDWSNIISGLSPEEERRRTNGTAAQRVIACAEMIQSRGLRVPSMETSIWEMLEHPVRNPKFETIVKYVREYEL